MIKEQNIFTVSEITGQIKMLLEEGFSAVTIIGEISNFKSHVSGHWYFTLKDNSAQISCTMWRGLNKYVFFTPTDGMKIIAKGRITVYPPRGNYQLEVRSIKPAGEGELQAAFEKLKHKLNAEGLFDEKYKKPIPKFPQKIGIVTAIGGAALRDMISTAKRRFPIVELFIAPAKVQGEGAASEIAASIKQLNKRDDIDIIIVGRGGGSLEDLWAFNEEETARAIFESRIPIISGVGHEIDFSISDFTADIRAATPTAAMELATPDREEIFAFISDFSYNATNNITKIIDNHKNQVNHIITAYGFKTPQNLVKNKSQFLDNLIYKLEKNIERKLQFDKNRINLLAKSIEAHDKEKILKKGFTLVKQENKFVSRAAKLNHSEKYFIKFYDGDIEVNKNE